MVDIWRSIHSFIDIMWLLLVVFQDPNSSNSQELDQEMIYWGNSLDGIQIWVPNDRIVWWREIYKHELHRLNVLTWNDSSYYPCDKLFPYTTTTFFQGYTRYHAEPIIYTCYIQLSVESQCLAKNSGFKQFSVIHRSNKHFNSHATCFIKVVIDPMFFTIN